MSTRPANFFSNPLIFFIRSSNMSAAAHSMVSGSAVRMSLTAPPPRPPSPMTPTLSFLFPAVACAEARLGNASGVSPSAAVPMVVFLTKLRREICESPLECSLLLFWFVIMVGRLMI